MVKVETKLLASHKIIHEKDVHKTFNRGFATLSFHFPDLSGETALIFFPIRKFAKKFPLLQNSEMKSIK